LGGRPLRLPVASLQLTALDLADQVFNGGFCFGHRSLFVLDPLFQKTHRFQQAWQRITADQQDLLFIKIKVLMSDDITKAHRALSVDLWT
jgi:hypothetical protein